IPQDAKVKLQVYSITGQLVAELVDASQSAGVHNVTFNAAGLASGTYIYKIQAGSFVQMKKMMLIK
ncbi:MAG: T9SS type A sorting domain-containing protein, partial [Bacteroidota bacterium]